MQLSGFLNGLFNEGCVRVSRTLDHFAPDDLEHAAKLIAEFERTERMEMPAGLPPFYEQAALWAAQYFYRAIQFVLLRELDAALISEHLKPFEAMADASAAWSVDLIFRHFGPLFKFSSGVAPDDPLVESLRQTAAAWPLSSVGMDVTPSVATKPILNNPALRSLYLDRIISSRDLKRISAEPERAALTEITGTYRELFCPGLQLNEAI